MDRTFEHYVDTTTTSTSNSSITPINKDVELRESNRIAAAKTRYKKKRAELEKRQRHEEKEELNRRLKGVEAKQKELINVMLNEIMVKKVENFFDGENALVMKQEQPTTTTTTNEYSQADWQPESSSISIQGNDCLNEKDKELDLKLWDFTQPLPSSLLITSESQCIPGTTTTTTQYSIEAEDKEDALVTTTTTTAMPYIESILFLSVYLY